MAKSKKSFILYLDYRQHLSLLTDIERGQLLMALFDYAEVGAFPELNGAALMAFSFIKSQIDRDGTKYTAKCEKNRENAGKRWQKENANACECMQPHTTAYQPMRNDAKHADTGNENENEIENENDITPPTPSRGNGVSNIQERRFDEFWKAYPKKVGKEAARKSWARIKPNDELFNKILAAIEKAKRSDQWQREKGRFIPNPATWLNQGRWDDELTIGDDDEIGGRDRRRTSSFRPSTGFRKA